VTARKKPPRSNYKPKVSPRRPLTMGEAKAAVNGTSITRRMAIRSHEELREPVYFQFLFDAVSMELVKIHATMRRVKPTVLFSDIMNVWLAGATDYSQALIREMLPPGVRAAPVPERYAGYRKSLGAAPVYEEQLPPDPPPPTPPREPFADLTPRHGIAPPPDARVEPPDAPPQPPVPAPSEVAAETPATQEQLTKMVEIPANPEVEWSPEAAGPGVRRFDPEKHAREAGAPGHGNAAQAKSMGFDPGSLHPDSMNRAKDR